MTAKRDKKGGHKATELAPVENAPVGTEGITDEDVRLLARVADGLRTGADLHGLTKKVDTEILPKIRSTKGLSTSEHSTLAIEMISRYGLDTLLPLHGSVHEGDMAVQMAQELVRDYECHTASEKAVAQVAANAFARIIDNSRLLDECTHLENLTQLHLNFISTMSKELDRATRQFDVAIGNLLRMKSPAMKVSVTAKTAFVGNNQQFNANHEKV